jgi:hypothetical protein
VTGRDHDLAIAHKQPQLALENLERLVVAVVDLLAADFSDDATILASLTGLRQDIVDSYSRLAPMTERVEQIPHRTRYLRLINDYAKRSLDTLSEWLDHVESELEPQTTQATPPHPRVAPGITPAAAAHDSRKSG